MGQSGVRGASPEIIRLAVMIHVRFPVSLRYVEALLDERSISLAKWSDSVATTSVEYSPSPSGSVGFRPCSAQNGRGAWTRSPTANSVVTALQGTSHDRSG